MTWMLRRLLRIHSPNEGVGMLIWLRVIRVINTLEWGGRQFRWMTVRMTSP